MFFLFPSAPPTPSKPSTCLAHGQFFFGCKRLGISISVLAVRKNIFSIMLLKCCFLYFSALSGKGICWDQTQRKGEQQQQKRKNGCGRQDASSSTHDSVASHFPFQISNPSPQRVFAFCTRRAIVCPDKPLRPPCGYAVSYIKHL